MKRRIMDAHVNQPHPYSISKNGMKEEGGGSAEPKPKEAGRAPDIVKPLFLLLFF